MSHMFMARGSIGAWSWVSIEVRLLHPQKRGDRALPLDGYDSRVVSRSLRNAFLGL